MVGWKKSAGVIWRCVACNKLRNPEEGVGSKCPHCLKWKILSHVPTDVHVLSFCPSSDASPVLKVSETVSMKSFRREARAVC
jgi:hypothetical protein